MKLAVTGATGFLGREVVRQALLAGHRVRALVRGDRAVPAGVETVQGDLGDDAALCRLCEGTDVVLHLAAVGVQSRDREWTTMLAANVQAPVAIARAAKSGRTRALIAAGTCLEYRGHGELPSAPTRTADLCDEDAPLAIYDPYGATKAAGATVLRAWCAQQQFPLRYLRLASMYGPGDDAAKVMPSAIGAARRRERFPMSPGEQVREWLHVTDGARAVLAAAMAPLDGVEVLNIGSGVGVRLVDVVSHVFRASGSDTALIDLGARPYRAGETHRLVMDVNRARNRLGFVPRVGLEDGLRDIVQEGSARE